MAKMRYEFRLPLFYKNVLDLKCYFTLCYSTSYVMKSMWLVWNPSGFYTPCYISKVPLGLTHLAYKKVKNVIYFE